MNKGYEPRTYREATGGTLKRYEVAVGDSDLAIYAASDIRESALSILSSTRQVLEEYVRHYPAFLTAMVPLEPENGAPEIVRDMCAAAVLAGVGPMAAVAGSVAARVGLALAAAGECIIVENGGDVFIRSITEIRCAVHVPPSSPFYNRLTLRIPSCSEGTGVCTSSGTVGHSYSSGQADAAVVLAADTALADAVATAAGNLVRNAGDIERGLAFIQDIPGIHGALLLAGERMGCWGDVTLA